MPTEHTTSSASLSRPLRTSVLQFSIHACHPVTRFVEFLFGHVLSRFCTTSHYILCAVGIVVPDSKLVAGFRNTSFWAFGLRFA